MVLSRGKRLLDELLHIWIIAAARHASETGLPTLRISVVELLCRGTVQIIDQFMVL